MADRPIVILMGGQSRRMGTDKAFVEFEGKTFLDHQLAHLKKHSKNIHLSVNDKQYALLKDQYDCILDERPDKGPLGGIYSSLKHLGQTTVFVPIDMPHAHLALDKLMAHEGNVILEMNRQKQVFPLQIAFSELKSILFKLNQDYLKIRLYINTIDAEIVYINNQLFFININNII